MVVIISYDADARGVDYITEYLSMLAPEECDQIFFAEFVVVILQSFHALILTYSFGIQCATEVANYGCVKRHLPKLVACIGLGL
jgi:hypothetical protein